MPNACYDGKKSNGYKGYWLMNTKNNKKFQETDALMCDMFLKLLDEYAFEDISISLLCQKTGITRATFYSHFGDMNHFFDAVAKRLFLALAEEDRTLIRNMDLTDELYRATFLALFEHILSYRSFYQVYVTKVAQLPFLSAVSAFGHSDGMKRYAAIQGITSKRQAEYCAAFYYTGLTAMIRMWLDGGCQESPDEMYELMSIQSKNMAR